MRVLGFILGIIILLGSFFIMFITLNYYSFTICIITIILSVFLIVYSINTNKPSPRTNYVKQTNPDIHYIQQPDYVISDEIDIKVEESTSIHYPMKYCHNCGKKIKGESVYCPYCGVVVEG